MLGQALASPPDRSAALIGSALLAGCTALYRVAVVRSSFERPAVPTMIAVTRPPRLPSRLLGHPCEPRTLRR